MYDKLRDLTLWIPQQILRMVARFVKYLIGAAKSNETLYKLFYDLGNVNEFSNLYEHEKMLADSVRVDTYAEGIRHHIKQGDVVIDLGTGTGILAILAARQGAKVYAIDHSEFIGIADKVARNNGIDSISFVKTNSRKFSCPEKVDFILHEQIGDNLFDENMIENLLDLKRRLLKNTGKILPGRFELFMEPVAFKKHYRIPFIWELQPQEINFEILQMLPELAAYIPKNYAYRSVDLEAFDYFLSTPEPMLSVDLNEVSDPNLLPLSFEITRQVTQAGKMEGIYQYFRVIFDDDIHFDTAPNHTKTHWGNRLFRLPQKDYVEGDIIQYSVKMDTLIQSKTWSVSLEQ